MRILDSQLAFHDKATEALRLPEPIFLAFQVVELNTKNEYV